MPCRSRPRRTARNLAAASFLLLPVWLGGCRNACQELCVEMAELADSCGYTWTDAEVDQCITDHKSGSLESGEAGVCRDGLGDVDTEWDCSEIEAYFDGSDAGDGGASDTGG